jgi:hypothetical protein
MASTPFEKYQAKHRQRPWQAVISACLEIATNRGNKTGWAKWAGAPAERYIQSIIGATEKRRANGAGVALVTDIGDLESVRLGGGGVYQDWLGTEINPTG